jgi:hypothetical protein
VIKDISSCLQDVRGAKADYQVLQRELECLQQALTHLDKLQQGSSALPSLNLDSIRYAALSCRRPLEQFLAKIRKLDKSLGVWKKNGVITNTTDKLKWSFGQKEEVCKLQSYLNIHVGTINILLAEHGLEKMDLASEQAVADQLQIRERLEDTRGIVNSIRGSLNAQALIVGTTQKMTTRLCEMIGGEFRTSWRSLGEMVAKVLYVFLLQSRHDFWLTTTQRFDSTNICHDPRNQELLSRTRHSMVLFPSSTGCRRCAPLPFSSTIRIRLRSSRSCYQAEMQDRTWITGSPSWQL